MHSSLLQRDDIQDFTFDNCNLNIFFFDISIVFPQYIIASYLNCGNTTHVQKLTEHLHSTSNRFIPNIKVSYQFFSTWQFVSCCILHKNMTLMCKSVLRTLHITETIKLYRYLSNSSHIAICVDLFSPLRRLCACLF